MKTVLLYIFIIVGINSCNIPTRSFKRFIDITPQYCIGVTDDYDYWSFWKYTKFAKIDTNRISAYLISKDSIKAYCYLPSDSIVIFRGNSTNVFGYDLHDNPKKFFFSKDIINKKYGIDSLAFINVQ